MLSKLQKQTLGILATQAYAFQDKLDMLDLPSEVQTCSKSARLEFWRQRVVMAELAGTGSAASESGSFRDAANNEYLRLKRVFQVLAGERGEAFTTAMREDVAAHTAPACEFLRQLMQAAKVAGLHENYLKAIARNKFKNSDLTQLSEWQLKQMMFTINNRSSAKRGVGETANRNKSQKVKGTRGKVKGDESEPPKRAADQLEELLAWLEDAAKRVTTDPF